MLPPHALPDDADAPRRLRWFPAAVAGYALTLLIWLSLEDAGALSPAVLGWIGAALIGFSPPRLPWAARPTWRLLITVRLAAIGGGAALLAAGLMLFKSTWHGHVVPDYPLPMIADMLLRAPLWMGVGLLIGMGVVSLGKQRV